MGAATFEHPTRSIVEQRIDPGGGDVWIAPQVIRRVEERMRVAAFTRAGEDEVGQRRHPAGADVGVPAAIVSLVEQPGGDDGMRFSQLCGVREELECRARARTLVGRDQADLCRDAETRSQRADAAPPRGSDATPQAPAPQRLGPLRVEALAPLGLAPESILQAANQGGFPANRLLVFFGFSTQAVDRLRRHSPFAFDLRPQILFPSQPLLQLGGQRFQPAAILVLLADPVLQLRSQLPFLAQIHFMLFTFTKQLRGAIAIDRRGGILR